MTGAAVSGASGALVRVAADIAQDWRRSGLAGGFVARHLDSGSELGFDVHRVLPLASVVKVPIALVVLDRIARGVLDPGCAVELDPVLRTPVPAASRSSPTPPPWPSGTSSPCPSRSATTPRRTRCWGW